MKVLLDTNICIYLIKRRPSSLIERFGAFTVGDVGISIMTLAELEYGVSKSGQPGRNREALEGFVAPLEVAPFDRQAAVAYGRIRAVMEKKGTPIGAMDLLIAAHALALGVKLVTNNEREFHRIPGLRVENWV